MKKRVCVTTATRAEYGLLKPIIEGLVMNAGIDVRIVVTGTHLSPEFGLTYQEIVKDQFQIDKKIEILLSSDTSVAISKSMGLALISFGEYFGETRPDLLIVLGDRYETLAICCAAMNARIPIAHLYGGETTEGAVDEAIRHAITKMSYLHFTSAEIYRKRVIQLGENPDRVFCVGAMGVENAINTPLLDRKSLEKQIGFSLKDPFAVVTFHPVTLESGTSQKQISELLKALDAFQEMNFIITKANADADGRIIHQTIDKYSHEHSNIIQTDSLGMVGYLSAVRMAEVVIGNSSSGLVEAPSFGVPTVNIGDRQKGRMSPNSVINCGPDCKEIIQAIHKALSDDFKQALDGLKNPYGDGKSSEKIISTICEYLFDSKFNLKKKFYDIEF